MRLRGLLCRITEWEVHITAQGPRLRNDLYCVKWDIKFKLYYTMPYHVFKMHAFGTFIMHALNVVHRLSIDALIVHCSKLCQSSIFIIERHD